MSCTRSAVVSLAMLLLAACRGGGGDSPPPPAPTPQIHSATVTAVETVRAADQLSLPVTGLPATGGAITVVN
jgi:hypothetical protein